MQITKIGKLLIAAEEGNHSRCKNISLNDISLTASQIDGNTQEQTVEHTTDFYEDTSPGTVSEVGNSEQPNVGKQNKKKWDEEHKMEARKMFDHLIREAKVPEK